MPTYAYRCDACSHEFERFQRMSDEPVKECEECGAEVRRVLFPVAVHFKGSGFYTTDYGRKSGRSSGKSSGAESSGSAGSAAECAGCSKESACPSAA